LGDPRERHHLEDLGVRWEDNIKMDLQEVSRKAWTGLIWLRIEHMGCICECDNKLSGPITCWEMFT
jgi:hypothetical protein